MSSLRDKGVQLFSNTMPKQLKAWLILTEFKQMFPDKDCPICKKPCTDKCGCEEKLAQELMESVFIEKA
ncbi:hypothetical protein D3C78_1755290 [compost metagenome]